MNWLRMLLVLSGFLLASGLTLRWRDITSAERRASIALLSVVIVLAGVQP